MTVPPWRARWIPYGPASYWAEAETSGSKPLTVPLVVGVIAIIGAAVQLSGGVKGLKAIADKADPKAKKASPAKA